MHSNRVAACDKHLLKGMKEVMGNAKSKHVAVSRVNLDAHYSCYCGKSATWYVRDVDEKKRGNNAPVPRPPAPRS